MDLRKAIPTLLLLMIISCVTSHAQNFTRITDAANPVVNDASESGGGSWVDINNDGWLDLFVSNGNLSDQNNSLYLNLGGGNFKKITTGDIVSDGGSSIGSTWADYDNDGFLDCFVTNRNFFGNFLYHGNGDTTFTKITTGAVVNDIRDSNSSSWVDMNNDGKVDLYNIVFGDNDLLYKNNGPDFTKDALNPIVGDGTNFSISGAWGDYNNDGLPDLFRGNSGTENDDLLTNNGNFTFTKTTLSDGKATLGASWADFDNDGDLDLFVANYLNNGNVHYVNSGAPSYTLTKITTGVLSTVGNCVGSSLGDIDNDGDLDLFVADDGDDNNLYLNNGPPDYSFTKVNSGDVVSDGGNSFGAVFGDYDNDGQLDLFVANRLNQQNFLYHNDGSANHWITIQCKGILSNRAAIGARVYVTANVNGSVIRQMQEVSGQTGYNSQNLWLHFGLGTATIIDTIVIHWPSGTQDVCTNVIPDKFYTAAEGSCLGFTGMNEAVSPDKAIHISANPNPCGDQTTIAYALPHEGLMTLKICDVTGKELKTLINENVAAGSNSITVDTSELPPGIYFLKMVQSGQQRMIRLMKQ